MSGWQAKPLEALIHVAMVPHSADKCHRARSVSVAGTFHSSTPPYVAGRTFQKVVGR